MATATKKTSDAAPRGRRREAGRRFAGAPVFSICEDNAGGYFWTVGDGRGRGLARSGSHASFEEAERAVRFVSRGAPAGRPPRGGAAEPLAAHYDVAAERWLDEGGHRSERT